MAAIESHDRDAYSLKPLGLGRWQQSGNTDEVPILRKARNIPYHRIDRARWAAGHAFM